MRSAIRPDRTIPTAPTTAPAHCTRRKLPPDRSENSVTQLSGKIVTRWNRAKLASGTKAPISTNRPWAANMSATLVGSSSRVRSCLTNSSVTTSRNRAKSATTLIVKAT